jgi:hypothetical protein
MRGISWWWNGCWCMPFCCMLAALQVGLRYRGMDRVLCWFFWLLFAVVWWGGGRVRDELVFCGVDSGWGLVVE